MNIDNYKKLIQIIDKKLDINNKEILISLKKSLKEQEFSIIKIDTNEQAEKYSEIFLSVLKIYTDLKIIESER